MLSLTRLTASMVKPSWPVTNVEKLLDLCKKQKNVSTTNSFLVISYILGKIETSRVFYTLRPFELCFDSLITVPNYSKPQFAKFEH